MGVLSCCYEYYLGDGRTAAGGQVLSNSELGHRMYCAKAMKRLGVQKIKTRVSYLFRNHTVNCLLDIIKIVTKLITH